MWSGEARIVMWFINPDGILCRHNFYHKNINPNAVERAQFYEYVLGLPTWLEYRPIA